MSEKLGISGKEFLMTQIGIINIGKDAMKLNLDGYITALATAEKASPFLKPDLFNRAVANIKAMRELTEKVYDIQIAMKRLEQAISNTDVSYLIDSPANKANSDEG